MFVYQEYLHDHDVWISLQIFEMICYIWLEMLASTFMKSSGLPFFWYFF